MLPFPSTPTLAACARASKQPSVSGDEGRHPLPSARHDERPPALIVTGTITGFAWRRDRAPASGASPARCTPACSSHCAIRAVRQKSMLVGAVVRASRHDRLDVSGSVRMEGEEGDARRKALDQVAIGAIAFLRRHAGRHAEVVDERHALDSPAPTQPRASCRGRRRDGGCRRSGQVREGLAPGGRTPARPGNTPR